MNVYGSWPTHRVFPYERRLALAELHALGATGVTASDEGVACQHPNPAVLVNRLTYLASLQYDGQVVIPRQHEVELRHLARRGIRARQATRFGVHGFHEYKGKFNPQLARGLINSVDPNAEVLSDPFAGSGTALIEALRLGLDAHGRDRSPMAVFLSTAKLQAFTAEGPAAVADQLTVLTESVGTALKRGQDGGSTATVAWWASSTAEYLSGWFTPAAYAALREALSVHPPADTSAAAQLSLLALSGMLRTVSLQEPQDLRVRRRPAGFVAPSLRDSYMDAADKLVSALAEVDPWTGGQSFSSRLGNADDEDLFADSDGRRLIVTSPPYATALPYIDTDRLSIMALGLATPSESRRLEASLTGSREWSTTMARTWRADMLSNEQALPDDVVQLLSYIEAANKKSSAGFRRAAVPALLYRYFTAMRTDFRSWHEQLRKGERAVVVVGRNRTGARGSQTTIETPQLLASCGAQVGFEVVDIVPLETWPRYGLHAANAVEAEDAVILQKQ